MNLNLTRELERAERMLKAQSAITKDLHTEVEDLTRRGHADKKELTEKLEVRGRGGEKGEEGRKGKGGAELCGAWGIC